MDISLNSQQKVSGRPAELQIYIGQLRVFVQIATLAEVDKFIGSA